MSTKNNDKSAPTPITKDSVFRAIHDIMVGESVPKDSCPTHIYGLALALCAKRMLTPDGDAMAEVLMIWEHFPKSPSAMRTAYWRKDAPAETTAASELAAKYS